MSHYLLHAIARAQCDGATHAAQMAGRKFSHYYPGAR